MTGSELLTIYEIVTAIICAFLPFVVLYALLRKRVDVKNDSDFYKFALYVQMAALGALVVISTLKFGLFGFGLVLLPICSLTTYVFGRQGGYSKGYDEGYESGFNDNHS